VCRGHNPIPMMLCLAGMIRSLFPHGAACGRLSGRSLSLFQEMHAVVALHSGLGACETETTAAKKVAHGNRCSNLPKDFALIHDRGMKRHKAKRREASMRPHDRGSRKTDAVSNSSAIGASSPGFIVEHRAGSGRHFGDCAPPKRAL
jgi:hypothetical protein